MHLINILLQYQINPFSFKWEVHLKKKVLHLVSKGFFERNLTMCLPTVTMLEFREHVKVFNQMEGMEQVGSVLQIISHSMSLLQYQIR